MTNNKGWKTLGFLLDKFKLLKICLCTYAQNIMSMDGNKWEKLWQAIWMSFTISMADQ